MLTVMCRLSLLLSSVNSPAFGHTFNYPSSTMIAVIVAIFEGQLLSASKKQ